MRRSVERGKVPSPGPGDTMSEDRQESQRDFRVIRVADHYETCSTRDRARAFYPRLLKRLEDAPSWGEIVLSFEDVDFVSPSFLDETLVRLAEDHPELAKRVVIRRLSPFTARRLRSILEHRNLTWTLRQRETEGEYEVGP